MAGFGQKVVQLWNDWQLTAAVLLSLSLHLLLLSTGGLRRRSRPRSWSKKYYWVLYIGSRWIAPYALGILSRASKGNADADIQAFWAAFLLFHLGGVDDFTALSLEDNKLWDRRALELTIHALTTGYVLFRYFLDPSFGRFIVPFVLIYLAGAVKYAEQVFALRRATMKKLIESVLGNPDAGPDYDDFMDRVDGIFRSGVMPSFTIRSENVDRPNPGPSTSNADAPMAMEAGHKNLQTPKQQAMAIISSAHSLFEKFKILFADGIFSFKDRQHGQATFSGLDAHRAFKVIEVELSFVYDRLYTKASVSPTKVGLPIRVASLLLTLAGSLYASFAIWRSSQYKLRHRCVTYTLLAEAMLTDVVALAARLSSVWSLLHIEWLMKCCCVCVWSANRRRWSECMAQSNLITICIQKLPTESEFQAFLRQLPPSSRIFLDSLGGTRGRGYVTAAGMLPAAGGALGRLTAVSVEELELWDGFQKYFGRQSLKDQIRSGSFWKYYKKTTHVPVSDQLKHFIFREIKDKERLFISRRRNSQERNGGDGEPSTVYSYGGNRALRDKGADLKWSIPEKKEFDESLLIWHIATDLRFREEGTKEPKPDPETRKLMDMGRELSNYLFYIMVVHPLMLSSSTTLATMRCKDTIAEARRHFLKKHAVRTWTWSSNKKDATSSNAADGGDKAVTQQNAHESLLKVVEDTPLHASVVKGDKSKSVLWDGCFLAEELKRIMVDPKARWETMCKVWVEMLCYAAVHCGGYQHAERLKEGGELITFVCLLMTHLGMGKHYRTEVGDVYPYLSRYSAAHK